MENMFVYFNRNVGRRGFAVITTYFQNSLTPIVVLMVVISLNIRIMIGLILSITLGVTST